MVVGILRWLHGGDALGQRGIPLVRLAAEKAIEALEPIGNESWRFENRQSRAADGRRRLVCLFARIVSRVDVVDAPRPDELNLDDRLLVSCPNIMRVFCRVCEA